MIRRLQHALDLLGYDIGIRAPIRRGLLEAISALADARADVDLSRDARNVIAAIENGVEGRASEESVTAIRGVFENIARSLQTGEPATGIEEIDQMLSVAAKGPPVEAMARVFEGTGSVEDRSTVRLYVRALEAFRENPTRDYQTPDPGQVLPVGRYDFWPVDAKDGKTREFSITLYQNRTVEWTDEQGRRAARQDQDAMIKSMLGDQSARRSLQREVAEFTIETRVGDEAYWPIVELAAVMHTGWDGTDEMAEAIDRALAPYFWRDVNPLLPQPLSQG